MRALLLIHIRQYHRSNYGSNIRLTLSKLTMQYSSAIGHDQAQKKKEPAGSANIQQLNTTKSHGEAQTTFEGHKSNL